MTDYTAESTTDSNETAESKAYGHYKVIQKSSNGTLFVDWKDSEELRKFLTPNGKIQSRKKTGLNAREQRMVAQAIKRSRYMGLLPYTSATL